MTYSCIDELKIALDLRVDKADKEKCLIEAGEWFSLNEEKHWFVVAEDGECALFDKDCKIDDLLKVKKITNEMIRKDIKKINIPDSVVSIGYGAFYNCESLKSINISNSVESIGEHAFSWCVFLKSINIPSSVKSIGYRAFSGCEYLENINIPDLVTYIGEEAFQYCISLKSINIPNSVKNIEKWAFADCGSLKEVIFEWKTLNEVKSMKNYPWGIEDESIIKAEI